MRLVKLDDIDVRANIALRLERHEAIELALWILGLIHLKAEPGRWRIDGIGQTLIVSVAGEEGDR